jgi:hypothetical protein
MITKNVAIDDWHQKWPIICLLIIFTILNQNSVDEPLSLIAINIKQTFDY